VAFPGTQKHDVPVPSGLTEVKVRERMTCTRTGEDLEDWDGRKKVRRQERSKEALSFPYHPCPSS
jgi:hypothetical protein